MSLLARIKSKVKKKLAKLRAKLATRKTVLIITAMLSAVILAGCQQTPSRSQQLTFEACQFHVYMPTNYQPSSVEIATQAMAIETAGNESQTASASADYSPGRIDSTIAE